MRDPLLVSAYRDEVDGSQYCDQDASFEIDGENEEPHASNSQDVNCVTLVDSPIKAIAFSPSQVPFLAVICHVHFSIHIMLPVLVIGVMLIA